MLCLSVKKPIGELNLKRALDEDTGVFSSFFSLLSSSSPLGHAKHMHNNVFHFTLVLRNLYISIYVMSDV